MYTWLYLIKVPRRLKIFEKLQLNFKSELGLITNSTLGKILGFGVQN